MADEYKVKITVDGDPSGAKKVEEGLKGVGNAARNGAAATKEQGDAADKTGQQILSLGETTEKGIGVGRMFSDVLNGNFYALGNVTAALKVTGAAMKTSLVGVALLALTALANFLPTVIEKLSGKKDSLEDGFERAKEAAAKLNAAKLEELQASLESIKRIASSARGELEKMQAAADKLDDAEMAAQLGENAVAPGLTDEERTANEYAIRGNFAERKRDRKLGAMRESEDIAAREVDALAAKGIAAGLALGSATARVDATVSDRASLNAQVRKLNAGLWADYEAAGDDQQAKIKASDSYKARMAPIQARQAQAFGPDADARLLALQKEQAARKNEFDDAQRNYLSAIERQSTLKDDNYRTKAVDLLVESQTFRENYAKRHGAVADLRTESDPVYRPDTTLNVRDSRSMREGRQIDTKAITEGGAETGRQMIEMMVTAVRERDAAMIREVRAQIKALSSRGN